MARLLNGSVSVRVYPALVPRGHRLAAIEGPDNAVLLESRATREIMLVGPGAGGDETASAVVADILSILGTHQGSFLHNALVDAGRTIAPPGAVESAFYVRMAVHDRPGVLARVASIFGDAELSIRTVVQSGAGDAGAPGAGAAQRARGAHGAGAGERIRALDEVRGEPGDAAGARLGRRRATRGDRAHRALPRLPARRPGHADRVAGRGRARRWCRCRGCRSGSAIEVHAKLEGMNPTASFKDRGMTMAVSKAVEEGATAVICASTGNTSASAAAYAARAGLTAAVVIPEGKIAAGKLAQALAHGARVLALDGSFDDALMVVRELVRAPPDRPGQLPQRVPHRRPAHGGLRGVRRARRRARRAVHPGRQRGQHQRPTGWASRRTARPSARGSCRGSTASRPPGAAPLVEASIVARPETVATAIRIGNPARGRARRMEAMRESGGGVAAVTDSQILAAYRMLAAEEGVFCEPASAASVAGLIQRAEAGDLARGETVVCVLTGHGLKDPDTAIVDAEPVRRLPADLDAVEEAVFGP